MYDLNKSLEAFHALSKILAFAIVDQFNMAKHVFGRSSHINDQTRPQDIANAVFSKYDELVVKFQKHGICSFMTNRRISDKETFYVHVLTWNMREKPIRCIVLVSESSPWKVSNTKTIPLNRY